LVAVLGLLVNMVGLFFFHDHAHSHEHHEGEVGDGHDHHGHSHHDHDHDHDHENENLYGVFLHVLADALGSVGVIASSFMIKYYDIQIADPICSFIISLMILGSVIPLIQMTSSTLILKLPQSMQTKRNKIMSKVFVL
jgi:zinc transporter 5/7